MDLRGCKLPDNIDELIVDEGVESMRWYQPFIFRDDLVVGAGGLWMRIKKSYVSGKDDPDEIRIPFLEENLNLGRFYHKLINIFTDLSPKSETFLDMGCSAGHFCFELARMGKKATGVDWHKYCYDIVSGVSGLDFEYIEDEYDNLTHKIDKLGDRTFDAVIASAIMLHVSDPHYFMAYLAEKAKNGILITTPYMETDIPIFRTRTPWWKKDLELPLRIEFIPSRGMVMMMLKMLGFEYIYSYSYDEKDPWNIREEWATWMAFREAAPEEMVKKHNMTLVDYDLQSEMRKYANITFSGDEILNQN